MEPLSSSSSAPTPGRNRIARRRPASTVAVDPVLRMGGFCVPHPARHFLRIQSKWLQDSRRAEYHDRLILLVFGRRPHLILCQFKRDAVTLVGDAAKMQCILVNHDRSDANAEKA